MSINIPRYFGKMQKIQVNLLDLLDDDNNEISSIKSEKLIQLILQNEMKEHEFKLILNLIFNIANNHYRNSSFFDKIFKIILGLKDKIKQTFSNIEIFNLFKDNKRIILFLIENEIIEKDECITLLLKSKYIFKSGYLYFYPEIEEFIDKDTIPENYDKKIFDQNRRNGENDEYICELIRKDMIDDFIVYVNKTNISLNSYIKKSIFETNSFLNGKQPTLVEYCAFFGSIQIFNFLLLNDVELNRSIWPYAIHGKNAEIIHILESQELHIGDIKNEFFDIDDEENETSGTENEGNKLSSSDNNDEICMNLMKIGMSLRCHHNDIANYFIENIVDADDYYDDIIRYCFRYYNFSYLTEDMDTDFVLYYSFKYNYFDIFSYLFKTKEIDIDSNEFNDMISIAEKNNSSDVLSFVLGQKDMNITDEYFRCSNKLTTIKLPSSITSIGSSAFESCGSLISISFDALSSIKSFGDNAFMYCSSLTSISIPTSVKTIGRNCFRCCRSLVHVTLPYSVTSISKYAFFECSSLKEIELPYSVTVIEEYAFYKCLSLSKIIIPSSVTSIECYAFYNCLLLKEITIPSSVTSIGNCAFKNCKSLSHILIPPSVKLGHYVFSECPSLE